MLIHYLFNYALNVHLSYIVFVNMLMKKNKCSTDKVRSKMIAHYDCALCSVYKATVQSIVVHTPGEFLETELPFRSVD